MIGDGAGLLLKGANSANAQKLIAFMQSGRNGSGLLPKASAMQVRT